MDTSSDQDAYRWLTRCCTSKHDIGYSGVNRVDRQSRAGGLSFVHDCCHNPARQNVKTASRHRTRRERTVYIGTSGWGWNASLALHSRTVCSPPGSVSRKIPNLKVRSIQRDCSAHRSVLTEEWKTVRRQPQRTRATCAGSQNGCADPPKT